MTTLTFMTPETLVSQKAPKAEKAPKAPKAEKALAKAESALTNANKAVEAAKKAPKAEKALAKAESALTNANKAVEAAKEATKDSHQAPNAVDLAKAKKATRDEADQKTVITLKSNLNPKKANSAAFDRFELYVSGMTVAAALAAGLTREDIRWDSKHAFISLSEAK